MVDKQLQPYVTQTEAVKAEGRVEKAIYGLETRLNARLNDQLRWITTTLIAVVGLAVAAIKLL